MTDPLKSDQTTDSDLTIKDARLLRSYSVVEVAAIAAGCNGTSPWLKIGAAMDLLAAAEEAALMTPSQLLHNIVLRREGRLPPIEEISKFPQHDMQLMTDVAEQNKMNSQILRASERDESTNRIKRSSLVHATCKTLAVSENPKYSDSLFRDFCKWWLRGQQTWNPSFTEEEFFSDFESGSKTKLIIDDDKAFYLVDQFVRWLRNRGEASTIQARPSFRSKTKQFTSAEARGAERDEDGKFKPKKKK